MNVPTYGRPAVGIGRGTAAAAATTTMAVAADAADDDTATGRRPTFRTSARRPTDERSRTSATAIPLVLSVSHASHGPPEHCCTVASPPPPPPPRVYRSSSAACLVAALLRLRRHARTPCRRRRIPSLPSSLRPVSNGRRRPRKPSRACPPTINYLTPPIGYGSRATRDVCSPFVLAGRPRITR